MIVQLTNHNNKKLNMKANYESDCSWKWGLPFGSYSPFFPFIMSCGRDDSMDKQQ